MVSMHTYHDVDDTKGSYSGNEDRFATFEVPDPAPIDFGCSFFGSKKRLAGSPWLSWAYTAKGSDLRSICAAP